jgi:hypothetical protein
MSILTARNKKGGGIRSDEERAFSSEYGPSNAQDNDHTYQGGGNSGQYDQFIACGSRHGDLFL